MKNYNSALELFTRLDNQKGVGLCYNNMGNVYFETKELDKCKESYRKAITTDTNNLSNSNVHEVRKVRFIE